jgi:hypothetical protein
MLSEKEYQLTSYISPMELSSAIRSLSTTDAINRVLVESQNSILVKSLNDIFNFQIWLSCEEILALLSICNELFEFTETEIAELETVLQVIGVETLEWLNPTQEFRAKYALSIDGFVSDVNHGEGRPLFIKLLTSSEVDPKAFAYMLTVMAHKGSVENDIYLSLGLCLENIQMTEEESTLLAKLLTRNGFNPSLLDPSEM